MTIKTFEVDWDDPEQLILHSRKVRGRIAQLTGKRAPKNEHLIDVYNSMQTILDTDISEVYSTDRLDFSPRYYVYAHCRSTKPIKINKRKINPTATLCATLGMTHLPFYIGKGTGNRASVQTRNSLYSKIKRELDQCSGEIVTTIIRQGINELEALMLESKLIDIFGLTTLGGYLTNLDEGTRSEERRELYKTSYLTISKRNK